MSVDCREQFATRILTDLGLCEGKITEVINKLNVSIAIYDLTRSQTTLAIIATDLYDCLRPTANDIARITADELSKTFVYILIITAIFILLISIIIVFTRREYYWIAIIIAIIFVLLYVGLVFLISYIARKNISNSITKAQNDATSCVGTAVAQLTKFESDQQKAISNALCAYSDTPVECS